MPFRLFQSSSIQGAEKEVITVVSGLPRSGTSMMMRMLEAGGIPVLTDHERAADSSNPKGYYEYERVKQLKEGESGWVSSARGNAVKVISALLEFLPPDYEYRVVFMQRSLAEVLASQREMLIQRGEADGHVRDETLADLYLNHLNRIARWMADRPNLKVIYVNYNRIIEDPAPYVTQLERFLRPTPVDVDKMLASIETSLYRQRMSKEEPRA